MILNKAATKMATRPPYSTKDYTVNWIKIRRDNRPFLFTAKTTGPVVCLNIFSFVISTAIMAMTLYYRDGMALVAVVLLSFLSSTIGLDHGASPRKMRGKHRQRQLQQPDKVVIRLPNGAFIIVECDGTTAEELFFTEFLVKYRYPRYWRTAAAAVGVPVLMIAILAVANSEPRLQLAFGIAHLLICSTHWAVACLPEEIHWNRSVFKTEILGISHNPTFTMALYKCITATKSIDWILKTQTAPDTPMWKQWLHEALEHADSFEFSDDLSGGADGNSETTWHPQYALSDIIQNQRINS
jgi:hypothetical protein